MYCDYCNPWLRCSMLTREWDCILMQRGFESPFIMITKLLVFICLPLVHFCYLLKLLMLLIVNAPDL
jgi:hypothetical protein